MLALALALVPAAWSHADVAGTDVAIYAPAADGPHGLLVVLHGCAQTNEDYEERGGLADAAEEHGLVVVAPDVPNGGVILGCWDYYGPAHDRTSRHDDDVLAVVADFLADEARAIDPARVYVAGLSSGGGEAWVQACLAPDVYAGVALAAAPGLGTTTVTPDDPGTTAGDAAALCGSLAGAAASSFSTQLAVVTIGTDDALVDPRTAEVAARAFAALYDAEDEADVDVSSLPGHEPAGTALSFADDDGPRVLLVTQDDFPHAWPAGTGAGAVEGYVAPSGIAFATVAADFFAAHARRSEAPPPVDGGTDQPPALFACACAAAPSGGRGTAAAATVVGAVVATAVGARRRRQ